MNNHVFTEPLILYKVLLHCDMFLIISLQGDLTELGDDDLVAGEEGKQVVVGVCAMAKKSQSKPMREILMRLEEFEYLKMVVFPEEVILKVSFI